VPTSVEATVKEIASKILHKDVDFSTVKDFKELGADSLDIVQIMVKVEDTYNIEMVDEEMQEMKNIKDFIAYIERKVAAKGGK
jgi:acyl carrier protein